MKKMSIWLDTVEKEEYESLKKDIDVDVLIIGGGITGLSTLYNLRNSNLNICLVEQDLIGRGVSGKTTAKINYLQELIYSDLEKKYSYDVSKLYLESQLDAIKKIKEVIKREKINCDLKEVDSYVFTNNLNEVKMVKHEKELLEKFNIKVHESNQLPLNINCLYAISVSNTYTFHPLKFLKSLKKICLEKNKKIYERTKIIKIEKMNDGYVCKTFKNTIKTKKIILACHEPFFLIPFLSPLKFEREKSFITASKSKYNNITLITSKNPCTSVRYYKDYIIFLSNSSNICNNLDEKSNFERVIKKCEKLNLKPEYIWKNDDLLTTTKLPYVGQIEKNNDSLLIGTGYNTWGMTNGFLAGIILSDLVEGRENKYEKLFSPLNANNFSNINNLIKNVYSNTKSYLESKILKNKKWYNKNIIFKNENGKNIAIYKKDNEEYIVYNKCPHLGCSLIFNEVEETWDCPCHASRFSKEGKCIKGPSNYDISYK